MTERSFDSAPRPLSPDSAQSDPELFMRYRAQPSPEIFAEIVNRHSSMVYATCLRMLKDNHSAEDATQAVFLVLFKKIGGLRESTVLSAWLYATAQACARNMQRAQFRRAKHEQQAHPMQTPTSDPAMAAIMADIQAQLDNELAALPQQQRDAVVLRYLNGFSENDAAREMKCPVRTLQNRVRFGLSKLRERLARRGVAVSAVALASLLAQESAQAAPVSLAANITAVCTGTTVASASALTLANSLIKAMAIAKAKLFLVVTLVTAAVCAPLAYGAYRMAERPPSAPAQATSSPPPVLSRPVPPSAYARWTNGPNTDPAYFPIAVWAQETEFAEQYKQAGFNLYLHLWNGPTETQLDHLKKAGMQTICNQTATGLKHRDDPTIVGWTIAQPDQNDGAPMSPAALMQQYRNARQADDSRPVMVVMGQTVAWDRSLGQDALTRRDQRYTDYLKASDIASFNIYPVVHPNAEVAGNLWYVPQGVERLRKWSNNTKIIWNFIECTRIESNTKPTPEQVKTEVWMSLIHGSTGLVYFAHEFKPVQDDHALADDPAMLSAVGTINRQVLSLAPALNSPTIESGATASSSNAKTSIACMVKQYDGDIYLFAVNMRNETSTATFKLTGLPADAKAIVLDENRTIVVTSGSFSDLFTPYAVHLYRIH